MLKLDQDKRDYYFCTSADWSAVVLAKSVSEAAGKSVKKVIDELKEGANIAPAIRVKKIKEKLDFSDKLLRMDEVLSDIGMHKESKHLKEIIKEL
jgi:translation initiation factor 2 alpha subunit (eIF-2alpha)